MNIGDLIMRVVADMRGFRGDLQKSAVKDGTAAGQTLGQRMKGGLKKAFSGGKGELLGALGIGAGIGLATVAIGKLVGVMGESVQAASDQREAFALTDQVFEGNTEAMKDWGAAAADAFGQSTTEALTFASNFGTAFKNVGFSLDDTADKAQVMTRLAADLGSAMNATGEEAATALRSGLLGESEPLRRFGVFLSEAAVKAEAVSSGIAKQGDVLTDNQKVLARYNIIMRQTADSQGAFGRDSGSLADAQKKLESSFTDAQAALGEALRPAMIGVVNFITEEFIPAVKELGDALSSIDEGASDNSEALGNLANLLHDLFKEPEEDARTFIGTVFDGFNNLLTLGRDINDAWTFWDTFESEADEAARATAELAESTREAGRGIGVAESAAATASEVVEELGEDGRTAGRRLKTAAHEAAEAFQTWRDRVVGYARDVIDNAYQIIDDRAELSAVNHEQAELRKVIASGNATREQKARYEELNRRQVELIVDLAANGVTTGKLVSDTMNTLRERLITATGRERIAILAAIKLEEQLARAAELAAARISAATTLAKLGLGSSGLIGGNWGPAGKAAGGPVQAGVPYVVGERRPELFVPRVSGTIMPHVPDGWSGGGTTYQTTINYPDPSRGPEDFSRALRRQAALG